MVKLTIDGKPVKVPEGTTILEAANSAGIDIPTLCYLKEINEIAACRICMVEIEGHDTLVPACNTPVEEGMVIQTNSPNARVARRVNLRLILSQHDTNCTHCARSGNCKLQKLANDYNFLGEHYPRELREDTEDFLQPLVRHENRCVKCMRCIQVCEKMQTVRVWDLLGTGSRTKVGVRGAIPLSESACTFCGQCITHCPVGALQARDDTGKVYNALADPEIVTVVQMAPAVRTSWGEYFGVPAEKATAERMVSALKLMGFDYVFDTDFGADLTIMEEGTEFLEHFTHKDKYKWPMFTSCCPGWVRFLKGQYPEYTDNLSTAKSPQQMFGAVVKSYFAKKLDIDPKKIFVVSLMPCVAKKEELTRPGMNSACGDPDVDVALTTREVVRMFRGEQINPSLLPETPFYSILGNATGAGVVFGATGGVLIAALRSSYYFATGQLPDVDAFAAISGPAGWKEAKFNVPDVGELSVAVVSGLGNARRLMEEISKGTLHYDFVEVMACPGGCAGGGGQPIHDGEELAQHRGEILWNLDKKAKLRFSHENPDIQALYRSFLKHPMSPKAHELLHTDHHTWEMPNRR